MTGGSPTPEAKAIAPSSAIGVMADKAAKIALERGLAILLDSDRYKEMRETARKVGWPHLIDPMKVYDLDRDPITVAGLQ